MKSAKPPTDWLGANPGPCPATASSARPVSQTAEGEKRAAQGSNSSTTTSKSTTVTARSGQKAAAPSKQPYHGCVKGEDSARLPQDSPSTRTNKRHQTPGASFLPASKRSKTSTTRKIDAHVTRPYSPSATPFPAIDTKPETCSSRKPRLFTTQPHAAPVIGLDEKITERAFSDQLFAARPPAPGLVSCKLRPRSVAAGFLGTSWSAVETASGSSIILTSAAAAAKRAGVPAPPSAAASAVPLPDGERKPANDENDEDDIAATTNSFLHRNEQPTPSAKVDLQTKFNRAFNIGAAPELQLKKAKNRATAQHEEKNCKSSNSESGSGASPATPPRRYRAGDCDSSPSPRRSCSADDRDSSPSPRRGSSEDSGRGRRRERDTIIRSRSRSRAGAAGAQQLACKETRVRNALEAPKSKKVPAGVEDIDGEYKEPDEDKNDREPGEDVDGEPMSEEIDGVPFSDEEENSLSFGRAIAMEDDVEGEQQMAEDIFERGRGKSMPISERQRSRSRLRSAGESPVSSAGRRRGCGRDDRGRCTSRARGAPKVLKVEVTTKAAIMRRAWARTDGAEKESGAPGSAPTAPFFRRSKIEITTKAEKVAMQRANEYEAEEAERGKTPKIALLNRLSNGDFRARCQNALLGKRAKTNALPTAKERRRGRGGRVAASPSVSGKDVDLQQCVAMDSDGGSSSSSSAVSRPDACEYGGRTSPRTLSGVNARIAAARSSMAPAGDGDETGPLKNPTPTGAVAPARGILPGGAGGINAGSSDIAKAPPPSDPVSAASASQMQEKQRNQEERERKLREMVNRLRKAKRNTFSSGFSAPSAASAAGGTSNCGHGCSSNSPLDLVPLLSENAAVTNAKRKMDATQTKTIEPLGGPASAVVAASNPKCQGNSAESRAPKNGKQSKVEPQTEIKPSPSSAAASSSNSNCQGRSSKSVAAKDAGKQVKDATQSEIIKAFASSAAPASACAGVASTPNCQSGSSSSENFATESITKQNRDETQTEMKAISASATAASYQPERGGSSEIAANKNGNHNGQETAVSEIGSLFRALRAYASDHGHDVSKLHSVRALQQVLRSGRPPSAAAAGAGAAANAKSTPTPCPPSSASNKNTSSSAKKAARQRPIKRPNNYKTASGTAASSNRARSGTAKTDEEDEEPPQAQSSGSDAAEGGFLEVVSNIVNVKRAGGTLNKHGSVPAGATTFATSSAAAQQQREVASYGKVIQPSEKKFISGRRDDCSRRRASPKDRREEGRSPFPQQRTGPPPAQKQRLQPEPQGGAAQPEGVKPSADRLSVRGAKPNEVQPRSRGSSELPLRSRSPPLRQLLYRGQEHTNEIQPRAAGHLRSSRRREDCDVVTAKSGPSRAPNSRTAAPAATQAQQQQQDDIDSAEKELRRKLQGAIEAVVGTPSGGVLAKS